MTYNASGGTLNLAQSINSDCSYYRMFNVSAFLIVTMKGSVCDAQTFCIGLCHLCVLYAMHFGYFVYLKQVCVNCSTNSTCSVFHIQQLEKLYESVVLQCIHCL